MALGVDLSCHLGCGGCSNLANSSLIKSEREAPSPAVHRGAAGLWTSWDVDPDSAAITGFAGWDLRAHARLLTREDTQRLQQSQGQRCTCWDHLPDQSLDQQNPLIHSDNETLGRRLVYMVPPSA